MAKTIQTYGTIIKNYYGQTGGNFLVLVWAQIIQSMGSRSLTFKVTLKHTSKGNTIAIISWSRFFELSSPLKHLSAFFDKELISVININ